MTAKIIIILSMLIVAFMAASSEASWIIYHKPEFRGRVIDAETKEPIEGAVVVVAYSKYTVGFTGRGSSVIKAKETLTDKNGEFYFPSYTTIIQPLSGDDHASFIIYKPGYGNYPDNQITPRGINNPSEEIFFSKGIGGTGELEGLVNTNIAMIKVTFGIVELPKLKTREERRKARMIGLTDYKLPLLEKALEEERKSLGE